MFKLLLVVLLAAVVSCPAFADTIVTNGGFETGSFSGWTLVSSGVVCNGVSSSANGFGIGCSGVDADPGPKSGKFAAYLGPFGQTDTLSQSLATQAGQTYDVNFWLANTSLGSLTNPNLFTASFGAAQLLSLSNVPVFGYTDYNFLVAATGSSTKLSFSFRHDPAYFVLDNVSVTPVPEPASLLLMGAGLTFFAKTFRRKLSK